MRNAPRSLVRPFFHMDVTYFFSLFLPIVLNGSASTMLTINSYSYRIPLFAFGHNVDLCVCGNFHKCTEIYSIRNEIKLPIQRKPSSNKSITTTNRTEPMILPIWKKAQSKHKHTHTHTNGRGAIKWQTFRIKGGSLIFTNFTQKRTLAKWLGIHVALNSFVCHAKQNDFPIFLCCHRWKLVCWTSSFFFLLLCVCVCVRTRR